MYIIVKITNVEEDCIIYVDQIECSDRASVGDIISHYLFTYRRIKGLVINGFVRDSHKLIKENYPIWCLGSTPLGCNNKNVTASKSIKDIYLALNYETFYNDCCNEEYVDLFDLDKIIIPFISEKIMLNFLYEY